MSARCAPGRAAGDGTYRLKGSKIFITYGEHDMTENIIHLVLARLPDAPAGTRGISLFLVPKFLVNADGSLGARNDVRCQRHRAQARHHGSPTCTMVIGDNGGAIGYLIGEENRGLACMFTMMNKARLGVGSRASASPSAPISRRSPSRRSASRAARAAPDGRGLRCDHRHPDVKRMLMHMRTKTAAARAICYATAGRARPCAARSPIRKSARPREEAGAADAARQGVLHRHRHRGRLHSACRSTAAWASSRKPARPSICAMRASPRSMKAPTAFRRSISSRASFATPFVSLGLVPEGASSLLVPRSIGHQRAFALLVMGRRLDGEAAREAGFVNQIAATGQAEHEAHLVAKEICALPAEAVAISRQLLKLPPETIAERFALEGKHFGERMRSEEALSAFRKFLGKKA
jgi:hypothetical protein